MRTGLAKLAAPVAEIAYWLATAAAALRKTQETLIPRKAAWRSGGHEAAKGFPQECAMSQAVIDFCEGLKTTLLALERQLGAAKRSLETGASQAESEAKKHVDEAADQLRAFKTHAGLMAQAIRADLPAQSTAVREKLKDFGAEAQVAMRHAVVFLAESAAKGAEGAAEALKQSAHKAQALAQDLRDDTAVTVPEPGGERPASSDGAG